MRDRLGLVALRVYTERAHSSRCLLLLACTHRYALGLIYANHGADIQPFLLESLRGTGNEVTQHGACLGLGECTWHSRA